MCASIPRRRHRRANAMPAAQEPKGAAADKKPSQRRRRGGKKHPKPDGDQRRRDKQEAPAEEPQEPVQRSRGRRNRNPQKAEPEAKKLEEDSDVLLAFGALLKTNDPAAAAAHAAYERHEKKVVTIHALCTGTIIIHSIRTRVQKRSTAPRRISTM